MSSGSGRQRDGSESADSIIVDASRRALTASGKTPFYQAIHALRYQRQAVIRTIQERTERRLICYVAGMAASIDRDDTVGFVDLLHNIVPGSNLDLLLHTPGGDIDAAEKLITMVRNTVGTGILRVVVPDFAKSAGTLIALGADTIVMSETSELGPIDPQVTLRDGNGNLIMHSVQNYLDAYQDFAEILKRDPTNVPAGMMMNKLDPATVKLFEAVRDRSRRFAEDQLKRGMFRNNKGNSTKTAATLLDTKRWLSHGQMISWQDAVDPVLGLSVEHLDARSGDWQQFWQLYCLQRLAVGDRQKLFESEQVSFMMEGPAG